jgi:hypothetical protein
MVEPINNRPICEIKWVDANGNPTPDTNPAVYRVRTKARVDQIGGRGVSFPNSQWFNCCAEHAKLMSGPGMHIWECEAIEDAPDAITFDEVCQCPPLDFDEPCRLAA